MAKERINLGLDRYCKHLLDQALKLSNDRRASYTKLIEIAIKNTYSNRIEQLREKGKNHARELAIIQAQIRELEEIEKQKIEDNIQLKGVSQNV